MQENKSKIWFYNICYLYLFLGFQNLYTDRKNRWKLDGIRSETSETAEMKHIDKSKPLQTNILIYKQEKW